jgi:uncharacterized protein with HEPN domain
LTRIAFVPSNKPRQRLTDIVYNIDAILRYTQDLDEAAFLANALVIDAVERCLSRISEAAVKMGAKADELVPGQPWRNIRGLGNRLRHEYDIISPRDLWAIVRESLPVLRRACQDALERVGHSSP